jgi:hypothetical protein
MNTNPQTTIYYGDLITRDCYEPRTHIPTLDDYETKYETNISFKQFFDSLPPQVYSIVPRLTLNLSTYTICNFSYVNSLLQCILALS